MNIDISFDKFKEIYYSVLSDLFLVLVIVVDAPTFLMFIAASLSLASKFTIAPSANKEKSKGIDEEELDQLIYDDHEKMSDEELKREINSLSEDNNDIDRHTFNKSIEEVEVDDIFKRKDFYKIERCPECGASVDHLKSRFSTGGAFLAIINWVARKDNVITAPSLVERKGDKYRHVRRVRCDNCGVLFSNHSNDFSHQFFHGFLHDGVSSFYQIFREDSLQIE